jgi:hypothetical protein
MVIYSAREEEHKGHIWKILKALIEARLYCKLSKCAFSIYKIDFLGYIINTNRVVMEKLQVITI